MKPIACVTLLTKKGCPCICEGTFVHKMHIECTLKDIYDHVILNVGNFGSELSTYFCMMNI